MGKVYNPGCAVLLYKAHYGSKIMEVLQREQPDIALHTVCCHHDPGLPVGTEIINTCAGCDRRFRSLYDGISTTSIWETLARSEQFPFPDYGGAVMTIHDPCPVRTQPQVHDAVRTLLARMNIAVIEPAATRGHAVCCGDSFYPALPMEQVQEHMRRRAEAMPCDEVCVYCVSCVKAIYIGGRKPRHLLDLLFGEETQVGTADTAAWHREIEDFIKEH